MNKPTTSRAWFSFDSLSLHVDHDGPLTADDQAAIWNNLPATGCSWVENGILYVQQRDGAVAFSLGAVA